MLPYPLSIFKIQRYFQNELRLNDVYCRNNLPKISITKSQCMTLNEYANIKTHCGLLVMLKIMLHM